MMPRMLSDPSSIFALVPAAGVGRRALDTGAATPKQYRQLAGCSMLRHSVLALLAEPRIAEVLVVVSPTDTQAAAALEGLTRTRIVAVGGAERHHTVANGLAELHATDNDWVLVHDAARPGLALQRLQALIDIGLHEPAGALLALPAADTVKRATVGGQVAHVQHTLPREEIWLAQTPQMFQLGVLRRALESAQSLGHLPTDEASAVEALGLQPRLVVGHAENFKVTWPGDFSRMESWLLHCQRSG